MTRTELDQLVKDWLKELKLNEMAENSIKQYKNAMNTFTAYLDSNGISEITKETVIDYKRALQNNSWMPNNQKRGWKQSTKKIKIIALNKFLKENGAKDLTVTTKELETEKEFKQCLSKDEYVKLLKYTLYNRRTGNNYRNYLILKTLGELGLRVSELKFITVDNLQAIRDGSEKLRITNKGSSRKITVPEELRETLLEYAESKGITGIIFHGNKLQEVNGHRIYVKDESKMLDPSVVWRNLKATAERAGVDPKRVFPHSMRHRFSLDYLDHNNNNHQALINLAGILGHKQLDTTRYYLADSPEQMEKSMTGIRDYSELEQIMQEN